MAIEVTVAQVKCIFNTNLTDEQIQCFIDDAQCYIESLPESIEDACGTKIANVVTKYLAAHLASMRDRQQTQTHTLDAEDHYSDTFGVGMDSSLYGQQAKRFDCTDQLGNEDAKADGIVPSLRFKAIKVY